MGGVSLVDAVSPDVAVIPAKAGIQYAAAVRLEPRSRGVLDRPVEPGDDRGVWGARGRDK
ncbi:hypothetical protein DAA51_14640 [Bradyrhizobium sp. WBAH10]|nr:hypothetical protein [Bradyrhizobium sp. WBAH30]MDD1545299.1 hypothetical protein [Bradyrhizobium sp. WBAH41]MDD1561292.1 hypothetical protein [Bradyrhizobium sp. WBAH23]MDD1565936.1 hypothetical protein [Bradyrhizobium sp. WBAH33]MDD1591506.1 hypothetical protein [Bradyrhizobium sp. WBAH42]NRB89609.1 hypothetical protein [Bradyrhizobium sp. WBAH10]QCJ89669.1 hypothetical protein DAA57_15050 [Bradyrhizobium yuanmingense]